MPELGDAVMPWPAWVRRNGVKYIGEWVAVRASTDETIDHDPDRAALRRRLDDAGESDYYVARVPEQRRSV